MRLSPLRLALVLTLTGTPMAAQTAGDGDGAVALDTITINASAATEGTGSWTSDNASTTSTGLPLAPRETPQSVSVVTQQQMIDANALSLTDAVKMTPGLTANKGNGDTRWMYFARGHEVINLQYDGVPTYVHTFARDTNPVDDLAMYDRVEFVRGANGLMEGAGEPSASINLVRKHAFEDRRTSIEALATSTGAFGLTLDHSTPLNAAGTVRARLVANGLAGDSYRDDLSEQYGLLYGTLDVDLDDRTTMSLGVSYARQKIDGYSWGGLPTAPDGSFYPYSARTSPSLPWEYSDRTGTVAFAEIEHRFDGGWTLRGAGRASWADTAMTSSYFNYWTTPDELTRTGSPFDYDARSYALDVRASGPLTLGGREHELVFGANANSDFMSYTMTDQYSWTVPDPLDLGTPGNGPMVPIGPWWEDSTQTQAGIYAAGRFSLTDALTLIAGGRLSWFESGSTSDSSIRETYRVNAEPVPYVGAVYDINPDWTLYASYTGIFQPQSERDPAGNLLAPATGTNLEAGVKASLLDGAVQATAAIFQTDETGLAEPLPQSDCPLLMVGCSTPAGKVRTRGIEFDATGAVTERWNVMAGYTWANTEYVEGENAGERFLPEYNPKVVAKLATTYDLPGRFEGLTLGGDLRAQSGLVATGTDSGVDYRIKQPAYAVFGLMARYGLREMTDIQVNVENLFDKEYYSGISVPGYGNFIGEGRTVALTLRHTF